MSRAKALSVPIAIAAVAMTCAAPGRAGHVRACAPAPNTAARPGPQAGNSTDAAQRPNIVLIVADDLDVRLGSLDRMPRLRSDLIGQGAAFANFLVNVSLCCPSRASLLRGQYVHNHQIYTNGPPDGGFEKAYATALESSTTATLLQGAGYCTALMGKYLNGYPITSSLTYIPPGWSEWYSPAGDSAYTNYNYTLNENGRLVHYGSAPEDYLTDVLSRTAESFIRRTAASGLPFFLYIAPYVPHLPATPAPRHSALFTGTLAPRLPSFNEGDVSDKPEFIRNAPLLTPSQIHQIDAEYRRRLQTLQAVDEMIHAIVQALEACGQLGNTYIAFTSDNGYHMGEHRLRSGKYTAYEEDIRVPFIVRGPGVSAGRTVLALAGVIDLLPTFAELAGVEAPTYADGRSLVALLHARPPASWRQVLLVEQYPYSGEQASPQGGQVGLDSGRAGVLEPPDPDRTTETYGFGPSQATGEPEAQYFGIRSYGFKYVEYVTSERELYELQGDPYELDNVYASAPAADKMRLAAWLRAMSTCVGEGCRKAEMAPPYLVWLPASVKNSAR